MRLRPVILQCAMINILSMFHHPALVHVWIHVDDILLVIDITISGAFSAPTVLASHLAEYGMLLNLGKS